MTDRDDIVDILKRRFRGTAGDTTIVNAINEGVRAAEHWLVPTTDTSTVTIADDDYDYSLPSDVVQLLQVWTRDDTDERWVEVSSNQWHVQGVPGSQTLYFDNLDGFDDGDSVRLEYLARLSELSSGSDTLAIGDPMDDVLINYLVEYALHVLYEREAGKGISGEAYDAYLNLSSLHFQKAQSIKRGAMRGRPAGRVHGVFPYRSLG